MRDLLLYSFITKQDAYQRMVGFLVLFFFSLSNVHAQGKLWGMTSQGGSDGIGIIFKTNADGSGQTVQSEFNVTSPAKGALPNGSLIQAANGKLYGTTASGGAFTFGVLYEYNPASGTFSRLLDFDGPTKGSGPNGSLVLVNGKLYGLTNTGGANYEGTLFEYDISSSAFIKKIDFGGATNGSNPYGSLCLASNGKLYGMTQAGGLNNKGALFEFDPGTSIFTKKYDFAASTGKGARGAKVREPAGWAPFIDPAKSNFFEYVEFERSYSKSTPRSLAPP